MQLVYRNAPREKIKGLLVSGKSLIDERDSGKNTALHQAIRRADCDLVQLLIKYSPSKHYLHLVHSCFDSLVLLLCEDHALELLQSFRYPGVPF